jgi:hypothetical protein
MRRILRSRFIASVVTSHDGRTTTTDTRPTQSFLPFPIFKLPRVKRVKSENDREKKAEDSANKGAR